MDFDMNKIEKLIFRDLIKSIKGIYIYKFYKKYLITPGQLAEFLNKYQKQELLSLNDDKVTLTEKGKKEILRLRYTILSSSQNKFNNIPKEFLDNKLQINEFYIPKIQEK